MVVQRDYPVRTCDGQQVVLLPSKAMLELCAPRLGLQPRTGPPTDDRVRGEPGPISEEAGHNHVRGGAGLAKEVEQLAACNDFKKDMKILFMRNITEVVKFHSQGVFSRNLFIRFYSGP